MNEADFRVQGPPLGDPRRVPQADTDTPCDTFFCFAERRLDPGLFSNMAFCNIWDISLILARAPGPPGVRGTTAARTSKCPTYAIVSIELIVIDDRACLSVVSVTPTRNCDS